MVVLHHGKDIAEEVDLSVVPGGVVGEITRVDTVVDE